MNYENNSQEALIRQTVRQMQEAGMTEGMISKFLEQTRDGAYQQALQSKPSQQDRIEIRQSKPDAEGFYIPTETVAQDLFAAAVMRGADVTPEFNQGLVGGPPRAGVVDTSMGNPNYKVNTEGQNVSVDGNGNIVRY